mmetsp:Transcript_19940/g.46739  ORF Transcript_19940/g.46739 Transcript_19940/m.46739 type:complete len:573 (+) Transcript_19940:69-1787(+)
MDGCSNVCAATPPAATTEIKLEHLPYTQEEMELLKEFETLALSVSRPQEMLSSLKLQHTALQSTIADMEGMLSTSQTQLAQLAAKVDKVQKMHREKTVQSLGIGEEVREVTESVDEANIPTDLPQVMSTTSEAVQAILQCSESPSEANNKPGKTHHLLEKVRQSHKPTLTFKTLPPIEKGFWAFVTALCKRVTSSYVFEGIISLVIVANSAMLGLESQMSMDNKNLDWASQAEACFLFVYTVECILRAMADRWGALRDGWFIFDVILVTSAYVEQIYALVNDISDQQVMVLRAMRLIRLVRTFRMIKQIRSIWRLVYGLVNSGQTMLSTYALLFLVLYVFGVLALELISNDDHLRNNEDTKEILSENFSSLGVTMITLTQFATLDSIADIYLPLTKQQPYLVIYFFLLMAIVSISLMNLVTAVIVEGALEHARQDREEEQKLALVTTKQMLPEIVSLFDMVDADSSGEIVLEEMREFEAKRQVPPQILDRASVDSMTELFEILDVDNTGTVNREEFVEGLLNIFLREVPVSSLQMIKMLRLLRESISKVQVDMDIMKQAVGTALMTPRSGYA